MLNETLLAIILSICITAVMFSIAKFLQKKLKIYHPKNTFLIYIIVLSTALSVIPFSTIAFSSIPADQQIFKEELPDLSGIVISNSEIVTTNQNITYSSTISPLIDEQKSTIPSNTITRYLQKISWNELLSISEEPPIPKSEKKIIDSSENTQINTSQFNSLQICLENAGVDTPQIINEVLTKIFINQNIKLKEENIGEQQVTSVDETANEHTKTPEYWALPAPTTLFYTGILILLILSITYVLGSIFLGKKHTLHILQATPCKDKKIITLIEQIANEFGIKTPSIFTYNGGPNAFVFGYPTTLAFSKELYELLTEQEFKAAMRHEIAHIKNHDIYIKPILQGLRLFFFYNPLVHIISLKLMKSREILADTSTYQTKKEKIALMEALIKINELITSSNKPLKSCSLYQVSLLSYNPAKLTLTERFTNLFEMATKKSILTILVSLVLLCTNASIFFVAGAVYQNENNMKDSDELNQGFSIDESYYTESFSYVKINRDSQTYFALIAHKNIYNIVSTNPESSQPTDVEEDQMLIDCSSVAPQIMSYQPF